jgi:hypothetical protein
MAYDDWKSDQLRREAGTRSQFMRYTIQSFDESTRLWYTLSESDNLGAAIQVASQSARLGEMSRIWDCESVGVVWVSGLAFLP